MSFTWFRIVLTVVFAMVAVLYWPKGSGAAAIGPLAIMPAEWNAGGNVYDYSQHFDEVGATQFMGYDYSGGQGQPGQNPTAYLRAMAEGDQFYPTRYMYWKETSCMVKGRLQRLINSQWVDYYNADLHLIHVDSPLIFTSYTSAVQGAGQWLVANVGQASLCSLTTGLHVHLSGITGAGNLTSRYIDSNETCWSDGVQCSLASTRKHSACPSSWLGWGSGKSGTISQYVCETWSLRTASDATPAFRAY